MLEYGEVGVKEDVRLSDGDLETDPVSRRGERSTIETVLLQPRIDSVDCCGTRRDELLDLCTSRQQHDECENRRC